MPKAPAWRHPKHAKFEVELRRAATQWFDDKGLPRHKKYSYCLPSRDQWHLNIICPAVAEFVKAEIAENAAEGKAFPLHRWIHHGLSSQAMLFNLIGPLALRGDFAPLRTLFTEQGIAWPQGTVKAIFEYEDQEVFNEGAAQHTSVDLVLEGADEGPRLFIECKLVEREFGGCSVFRRGDCEGRNPAADSSRCYLHYIGRCYWTVLQEQGFVDGQIKTDSTCILADHYQFFREAALALHLGGVFVLLSDERSPVFYCKGPAGSRGLMDFLMGLVPKEVRARIAGISIQQVVEAIKESGGYPWIAEFEKKYGLA